MKTLKHLFERNKNWAESINKEDPEFFSKLAKLQAPEYLWIGCADSRVPANQLVDLPPGEVFVHRNIANVVVHSDMNCLSVLQYAVEVLKVKHIIVNGHYGCGGVRAAMENKDHGLIDNWLRHIRDVARYNSQELQDLKGEELVNRMCELNVLEQVSNVCNTTIVQNAWKRGESLCVHGWIYDIGIGRLKDLGTCITSLDELKENNSERWGVL